MKRKSAWIAGLLVTSLLLAGLAALDRLDTPTARPADRTPLRELPWRIQRLPSGDTRVFGLTLATRPEAASTMQDAQNRWAPAFQMAVVTAPGEAGMLEGQVDPATMGFITGRLVVTAQATPEAIKGYCDHAVKVDAVNGQTRHYHLNATDTVQALRSPILALTFVPQANLDEDTVKAHFGEPAERVRRNAHAEHWLYPDQGLGITVDSQGQETLQYVAPGRFAQLRQPVLLSVQLP